MAISDQALKRAEAKFGKDSPTVQLLRNSRMGEGRTARDLYVTGSFKSPKFKVETAAEEGSQNDS